MLPHPPQYTFEVWGGGPRVIGRRKTELSPPHEEHEENIKRKRLSFSSSLLLTSSVFLNNVFHHPPLRPTNHPSGIRLLVDVCLSPAFGEGPHQLPPVLQLNRKNQLTSYYSLPSAPVAKTILRRSPEFTEGGFSWVLVDAEHGLINDSHYYEVCPSIIELNSRMQLLIPLPSLPMPSATRALALLSVCPGPKSG